MCTISHGFLVIHMDSPMRNMTPHHPGMNAKVFAVTSFIFSHPDVEMESIWDPLAVYYTANGFAINR